MLQQSKEICCWWFTLDPSRAQLYGWAGLQRRIQKAPCKTQQRGSAGRMQSLALLEAGESRQTERSSCTPSQGPVQVLRHMSDPDKDAPCRKAGF